MHMAHTPHTSQSHRLNTFPKPNLRKQPPIGSHIKRPWSTPSHQDNTKNTHITSPHITTQANPMHTSMYTPPPCTQRSRSLGHSPKQQNTDFAHPPYYNTTHTQPPTTLHHTTLLENTKPPITIHHSTKTPDIHCQTQNTKK